MDMDHAWIHCRVIPFDPSKVRHYIYYPSTHWTLAWMYRDFLSNRNKAELSVFSFWYMYENFGRYSNSVQPTILIRSKKMFNRIGIEALSNTLANILFVIWIWNVFSFIFSSRFCLDHTAKCGKPGWKKTWQHNGLQIFSLSSVSNKHFKPVRILNFALVIMENYGQEFGFH